MIARLGRQLFGALSGVLWGLGGAVLIQQFGVWPLDAALTYGAPLTAAVVSGWWARRGARRSPKVVPALVVGLLPFAPFALQAGSCDILVDDRPLSGTNARSPIDVDPENSPEVNVRLEGDFIDGVRGTLWVEIAGVQVDIVTGPIGAVSEDINLVDNGFYDVGPTPGIFHVGGETENGCSVDGYVRVLGNPFANPIGAAAGGAVLIGLGGTWIAGRRPKVPTAHSGSKLRRNGQPLRAGRAIVRTPGLDGRIDIHDPTGPSIEATLGWTEETTAAFDAHGLETRHVLEMSQTAEWPHPTLDTMRATPLGEPGMSIQLPDPGPGFGQIVLATDEGGVATWHYPRLPDGAIDTTPGRGVREYRLARRVAPSQDSAIHRLAFTSVGSKLLSTMVFPLLDPVFGQVGALFARRWEAHHRPYRLRTFTPDDFNSQDADQPDWESLRAGKSLLLIHGTFSSTHAGFAGFSRQVVADLAAIYDGRVFAFDHPTLSDDPRRNVEWLLAHLPAGAELDVDIVCHSRGGLVSRVLAERQPELAGTRSAVHVDKVVFAGSPNAGTILAEPSYVSHLIDAYTNLLNFVPGPFVTDLLGALITAIKQTAVGAVAGLEGLQSMRPAGPFLKWLNRPTDVAAQYFAIAGDYEPAASGLRQYAANRLMDRIFREPNDLVVPFEGTFGANGSPLFPITARHEFVGPEGVPHSAYFENKEVRDQLLDWLDG